MIEAERLEMALHEASVYGIGATSDMNQRVILKAAKQTAQLRAAISAFSAAVSVPGGPSLAVQRHDPSWQAWKTLCDAANGQQTGKTDG